MSINVSIPGLAFATSPTILTLGIYAESPATGYLGRYGPGDV